MEGARPTAAEREREAREEAQRKARVGMRLGTVGVVLLFASGFGAWFYTSAIVPFLAGMVLGIVLLLAAFFMVRGSVLAVRGEDPTKIL